MCWKHDNDLNSGYVKKYKTWHCVENGQEIEYKQVGIPKTQSFNLCQVLVLELMSPEMDIKKLNVGYLNLIYILCGRNINTAVHCTQYT